MRIIITICGRGGSKGIPGKNIRELNGKSLIAYSIEHANQLAQKFPGAKIALSTDSEEIKSAAEKFGLATDYQRPDFLATDKVGKIDVLKDVLEYHEGLSGSKYDFLVDLDITSPLRALDDMIEAFNRLKSVPEAYNIFSVSEPRKNPYFNVVEEKDNGFCKLVKESEVISRQTAPKVYDMNASFYIYRRSFFEDGLKTAVTPKSLFYLMDHICFDLDEELDFLFMELLLRENKLDFDL